MGREEMGLRLCRFCNHLSEAHAISGCGVGGCECPGFGLSYTTEDRMKMLGIASRAGMTLEDVAKALNMEPEGLRIEASQHGIDLES